MMKRLAFEVDEALDARFPAKRICRAEILTKDGKLYVSDECEPRGEAHENIGVDWLSDKFRRITAEMLPEEGKDEILSLITEEADTPIRKIVDTVNKYLLNK